MAFGLIGSVLSIWATVIAHNVRREMQVKLLEPQLDAYRKGLERTLRGWYYTTGNGIFLSKESRALLVEAKKSLLDAKTPSSAIRERLSTLRSQMKNDIGVYGKEDLAGPHKI